MANVLKSHPEGGLDLVDGGGGRGNHDSDGGVAASGAGGSTFGRPGSSGNIGISAGPDASSGGASNGSVADGASGPTSGSSFSDPRGPERKALIDQYCSTFDAYPCLQPTVTSGDTLSAEMALVYDAARCGREQGAEIYYELSPGCWDAWAAAMKCISAEPHQCPCAGTGCFIAPPLQNSIPPPADCMAERRSLLDCNAIPAGRFGKVTGSRMPCQWVVSGDGATCQIYCDRNQTDTFHANCMGAPGGPYDCTPTLNDRKLYDDYWNSPAYFVSGTCEEAAQTMADGGGGVSYVDCCVSWVADSEPKDRCSCTDDPMKAGFATCADAAAYSQGKVVDLCPQYLAVPNLGGGFPNGP